MVKNGYKLTEIGEIPEEWGVVRLEEISKEIYRYPTYYNIKYVNTGIPEVRGELIKETGTLETDLGKYRFISKETSSRFPRTTLEEGDFVLSVRGTMGKIAIVPKELEGSNITANLIRISPKRSILHSPFLKQFFLSRYFQNTINYLSSQTTIKTITAPTLKSINLPLPPFSEQQKIAEILGTADESIQKTNEVIEKTQKLKKGLMQQLLTKGIGHTKFKQTEIGEIPEEWGVVKLGDERISKIVKSGGTPLKHVKEFYQNGNIPFVKISDMTKNSHYFYDTEVKITEGGLKNSSALLVPEKSILFSMYGTIGKVLINDVSVAISQNIAAIIPQPYVDVEYLYYSLNQVSSQLSKQLKVITLKHLDIKIVKDLELPFPSLPEQQKIAEILSGVDEKIDVERKRKEKLVRLKKGLMQDLLTGKVRVEV